MQALFRFKYLWLSLAVILLILYFFLTPSRVEEMRKKRAAKKNKNLVQKIQENAKMKESGGILIDKKNKTPNGLRYGMDNSSDLQPIEEGEIENRPPAQVQRGAPQFTPDYGSRDAVVPNPEFSNPYLSGRVKNGRGTIKDQPAKGDMYYPPSANPKPESQFHNKELFDPGFGVIMKGFVKKEKADNENARDMENYQEKEMRVAFEGTRAYFLDDNGKPQPVADGFYEMPNSTRKVLILNGKKIISK